MSDSTLSNHFTAISQHPAKQCRCCVYLLVLSITLQVIQSSKLNMQICNECNDKTQKLHCFFQKDLPVYSVYHQKYFFQACELRKSIGHVDPV
jgi:hypothetical protein